MGNKYFIAILLPAHHGFNITKQRDLRFLLYISYLTREHQFKFIDTENFFFCARSWAVKEWWQRKCTLCNVSPQVLIHKLLFSIKVKFKLLLTTIKLINSKSKYLHLKRMNFVEFTEKCFVCIHADKPILYFLMIKIFW